MEAIRGRPEAAAEIWNWRGAPRADGVFSSDPGRANSLRWRGSLQALVGIAIGSAIFIFWSQTAGTVVLTIGTAILLSALLSPRGAFAMIERGFHSLGHYVGRGLTFILMSAIFYLIFLPFGALFRRGRRDPMKRFFEPEAETYWSNRELARAGSSFRERQY